MGRLVDVISLQGQGAGSAPLCATSQIGHHVDHLGGIDARVIPTHPVTGLHEHPPDLPLGHAAHELLPRGLIIGAVLNARLSGVVQKLIVADPEGSVPGFVVCPTVVGLSGHGSSRLVDVISLDGLGAAAAPLVPLGQSSIPIAALRAL